MKFLEALEKLKESEIFKNWNKDHKDSFLAHGFIMSSEKSEGEWQIGFFNPKSLKVLTFVILNEITMNPESEVMNKEIIALDINLIKSTVDEAFEKADEVQKEKYSTHLPLKKMAILQNSPEGQVWNITLITRTFKTLNINVSTLNGEVVKDQLVEIFSFDK